MQEPKTESSTEYYYAKGQDQIGPQSLKEIQSKIHEGDIKRETRVWAKGMTDWLRAEKVGEIEMFFAELPPELDSVRQSKNSFGWKLYSSLGESYVNFCIILLAISIVPVYIQGILLEEYSSLDTFTNLPACAGAGILTVVISTIPAWFAPFSAKIIKRQMRVFLIWLFLVLMNQGYQHLMTRKMLLNTKEDWKIWHRAEHIEPMSISDIAFVLESKTIDFIDHYTVTEIKSLTPRQRSNIKEVNEW